MRAKANRALQFEDDETQLLWDYMGSLKSIGKYRVNIPKRNGELGREAHINVSASEIRLLGKGRTKRSISLHTVYAKELNLPSGKKGVE